ncbi:hypothetical protein AZE42_12024, partial [Rhizopogon vesiculosus]
GRKNKNLRASLSHQRGWTIAQLCLQHLVLGYAANPTPVLDDDAVFRGWLEAQVPLLLRE